MHTCLKILLIIYTCCLECSAEDTVTQPRGDVFALEGESVALDCTYKASTSAPDIFWYIQYPHGVPKLILRQDIYETGVPVDDFKDRFQAKINQTLSSVPLTIQKMQLSDSAVYYCALRPTVTVNGSVLKATPPHPRLSATVNKDTKHVNLEISSAEVTDSALYYCALQPTVTGNP
ncbi:hypothetical protein JZ751_014078 [Albula glossodonta]|uniref:Ig-like domain-containing protein n=1 Tax=Albula glossodonta TaxID=121402 RepID=A0A8T2NUD3_9TELE|nr:hypothetical protein JZ751_014078 [Albula glossodonta]